MRDGGLIKGRGIEGIGEGVEGRGVNRERWAEGRESSEIARTKDEGSVSPGMRALRDEGLSEIVEPRDGDRERSVGRETEGRGRWDMRWGR